jgi:hypothetical protein
MFLFVLRGKEKRDKERKIFFWSNCLACSKNLGANELKCGSSVEIKD